MKNTSSKALIESREEMEKILREETLGFLGLAMYGRPYVVPLTYGYVTGKILFHVVCYGRARIIEDIEERGKALNTFIRCLQPDADEIPMRAVSGCYAVEIEITKMTGRRQRKGLERTYWEYCPDR